MTIYNTWAWVLDPPQNPLATGNPTYSSTNARSYSLFLTAILCPGGHLSFSAHPPVEHHRFSIQSLVFEFCTHVGVVSADGWIDLSDFKSCTEHPIPLWTLVSLGAVALIPLHLMLPLALICHPLKLGGLLIYGLGN